MITEDIDDNCEFYIKIKGEKNMNNKTDKGFFIIHDKTDRFHVGAFIVYDKFFKECYLFLCLGKHDFSIGYRWK